MDTMQIKLMIDNYFKMKERVRELFIKRGFKVPQDAILVYEDKKVKFIWTKGYVTRQVSMTIDEVEMDEIEYLESKGK